VLLNVTDHTPANLFRTIPVTQTMAVRGMNRRGEGPWSEQPAAELLLLHPTPQRIFAKGKLCQRASTYQISLFATINTFLNMGNVVNLFCLTVYMCSGLLHKISSWNREDGNYFKSWEATGWINKRASGTTGWHWAQEMLPRAIHKDLS